MSQKLHPTAQKMQDLLQVHGADLKIFEYPATTRTSQDAARAAGCLLGQIAKSIVFQTAQTHKPVLVITSGPNRVDEKKIQTLIGEPLHKAEADFVREHTGFAIGGIPPVGHPSPIVTYMDQDLMQYETVWAAAGTPNAIFELTPQLLLKITGAQLIEVTQDRPA